MNTGLTIDLDRLMGDINELAEITEVPPPAVTRVIFSERDLVARAWMQKKCEELGLTLRVDAIGNLFARWVGSDPALSAIGSGSHIDAIPNAGRYDGVLGVLGVLAAFRSLRAAGWQPKRSLELLVFTSEEPTRFGVGCLGSRLLSGAMKPEQALALKDKNGKTLAEWLKEVGWNKDDLKSVQLSSNFYHAFIELHIEQGPLLEKEGLDIGAVEKIAAPSAFRFRLQGAGGHAGGVLMPGRRDALLAGCEIALAIEEAALTSGSPDTVATTGVLAIEPGAINSIPFQARLEVDLRDTNVITRQGALEKIRRRADEICRRRQIVLDYEQINLDPPALGSPDLVSSILQAADRNGFSSRRMTSRAYHDSLFMAQVCPISMIFIPCREGVSHRPDEYSSPEQIRRGVTILAELFREYGAK